MTDKAQEGGVTFSGSGSVTVQGDVVGRDKNVTSGVKLDEVAKLFEQLNSQVRTMAPADKQAELETKIAELEKQARAKEPDVNVVGSVLKWIKKNVPGASAVVKTVLNQPVVGSVIKGVASLVLDED